MILLVAKAHCKANEFAPILLAIHMRVSGTAYYTKTVDAIMSYRWHVAIEAVKHHLHPYFVTKWQTKKKRFTKLFIELQVSERNTNKILPLVTLVQLHNVHVHY